MTDSGSGAFENVSIIKAVLEETRNDVKLHSVLVERSTVYLKDIAVGGCAEEVLAGMPSEHTEWIDTFNEAWQAVSEKVMPAFVASRAKTWAGAPVLESDPRPALTSDLSGSKIDGGARGGLMSGDKDKTDAAMGTDEWVSRMLKGLVVSDHDVSKAISDIKRAILFKTDQDGARPLRRGWLDQTTFQ